MSAAMTGGCQCGAVRYRAEPMPDNAHICHCRMCQKAVGNFFAALVGAPRATFAWTRGEPAAFRSSARVERGYCRDCGTPLFYRRDGGEYITLTIGSFDEPARLKPATQDGIEGRLPWFDELHEVPDLGETESGDYAGEAAAIKASSRQHPDHDTAAWAPKETP